MKCGVLIFKVGLNCISMGFFAICVYHSHGYHRYPFMNCLEFKGKPGTEIF